MLAVYRRTRVNGAKMGEVSANKQDTLKLTDQFVALLILVFADAGLMDVSFFPEPRP